jgi:hypothetical protein
MRHLRAGSLFAAAAVVVMAVPGAAGAAPAQRWNFGPQRPLAGTAKAGIGPDVGRINVTDAFTRSTATAKNGYKAFQVKGTLNVQVQKRDSRFSKYGLDVADCRLGTVAGSRYAVTPAGDRLAFPPPQRLVRYGNQAVNVTLGLERLGVSANAVTTFRIPRYKYSSRQPQVGWDPSADNSHKWTWDYTHVSPKVRTEQLGFSGILVARPPLSGAMICSVDVKQDNWKSVDDHHFGSVTLNFRNVR